MKPELQRVKIAEACGWTKGTPKLGNGLLHWKEEKKWDRNPDGSICYWLPDYLSDLNAMHEAEKVLTEEQQQDYVSLLLSGDSLGYFAEIHTTAAQRAEAFLRTLGLWEDEDSNN